MPDRACARVECVHRGVEVCVCVPRLLLLYTVDIADSGGGGVVRHISGANGFLLHHRLRLQRESRHTHESRRRCDWNCIPRAHNVQARHANEPG